MSEKKKFGKFLALATAAGAVAAGVSYFLKYRSFHKELDQDFHDFEHEDEDDFDGSLPHESEAASRTYVTLGEKKEETKEDVYNAFCNIDALIMTFSPDYKENIGEKYRGNTKFGSNRCVMYG